MQPLTAAAAALASGRRHPCFRWVPPLLRVGAAPRTAHPPATTSTKTTLPGQLLTLQQAGQGCFVLSP
ncbi:hypothetical protein HMPREF9136_1849 [Prevotella dentalis DSM 3688]|uniref:Uncharacterized protein n=1 Tax=Prevotella dentalis (strain ATCC 49559 / DSM 3688 / JCM 13448 / NCTC 12043 / ES 2772) TaxID=908937 RepID=F9D4S1_PREDD|nr:hypothetical protein HMPREF9136_1849 [Prevotella dentalis DSM 3688]